MCSIKLRNDEQIIYEIQPTPLAFLNLYATFFLFIIIGMVYLTYWEQILQYLNSIPLINWISLYAFLFIWSISLIFPYLLIAVVKISWKWPVLALLMILVGYGIYFTTHSLATMQWLLIVIGATGVGGVELYRRAHRFYITNQRIISEITFVSRKRRELTFGKITDIALIQGFLGRIFNFGTIVPITASGFGLGEDKSALTIGGGLFKGGIITGMSITGGYSVHVPRYKSFFVIYGVKNPRKLCDTIAKFVHEYEQAPYLKKISEQVKNIIKKDNEKDND